MSVWGEISKVGKKATKAINKAVSGLTSSVSDAIIKSAFGGISAYDIVFNKGKTLDKVTKSVEKGVKDVTKPVAQAGENLVQSAGKMAENYVSGTAKLITGDVKGAVDKYGRAIANQGNVMSLGTADFSGRKKGMININSKKYADAILGRHIPQAGGLIGTASEGRLSLRAGRKVGGGSMSAKAKYPLGGQTGVAGK